MKATSGRTGNAAVAITGVGIVSSLGVGAEEWLAAACEGEPAFEEMPVEETGGIVCRGAPVRHFDVVRLLDTRKGYLDRHTALLLGAMSLALRQSGWTRESLPRERAGLTVGSAWGGLGTMSAFFRDVLTKGAKFAKPILFPHAYANTAAAMAAIEWAIAGPHEQFAAGRLASAQALVAALDTLRAGEADVVFAGGCEALSPGVFRALQAQGRLDGIVPGEGAAVLVLETLESAHRRGAGILGHLLGGGISGQGLKEACAMVLADAGLAESHIGAVLAASSGLDQGVHLESEALRTVFDDGIPPLAALAGLQGDCLGAATALNAAAAILLPPAALLSLASGRRLSTDRSPTDHGDPARSADSRVPRLVTAMGDEGSAAVILQRQSE